MQKQQTILFTPLNWGLGHATRMVPLIRHAFEKEHKVIIGADGAPLSFLKQEFPKAKFIKLKGFKVNYWPKPFFNLGLFIQMPLFYLSTLAERLRIAKITSKHKIDTIISDNRYGCRNKATYNIIVSHQLFIKSPKTFRWATGLIHFITKSLLLKFNECWVPDYADIIDSLSGELSHGKSIPCNVKYIGPLSRFKNIDVDFSFDIEEIPDVLILISGPEPQRTFFEKQMEIRYGNSPLKVLMLCGKPDKIVNQKFANIQKVAHLPTNQLLTYLRNSKKIIARSGYSTIMDLHTLSLSAELIPTPGQPEQEYLFEYHHGGFVNFG